MAFKPRSVAETKAADLGLALARIAEYEGVPVNIGVEQIRRTNPRLTPLAIGQMVRRYQDIVEAGLADLGFERVDYADQGPGRGRECLITAVVTR